MEKRIRKSEIRFDDGRTISVEQRKKAYATIKDIAEHEGNLPEVEKELMKYQHMIRMGCDHFSLSNCSMDMAREFINTLMEHAITTGVPLTAAGVERTDDIGRYLYYCIKAKKCLSLIHIFHEICRCNGKQHCFGWQVLCIPYEIHIKHRRTSQITSALLVAFPL